MQALGFLCMAVAAIVAADQFLPNCFPRTNYPKVFRDESVIDDYFGVKVKDPFRWLEDLESTQTKKFIEEQNRITRTYIDLNPVKKNIREELTQFWNYPRIYTPMKVGSKYFSFRNIGLQNQDVLYVQDRIDGEPRVFLDPNTLSDDGSLSIANYEFSEDGSTLAYVLSRAGSEWMTIHFMDVATGKDYPEILENVKHTKMAWAKDNQGFFYSRYPAELRYDARQGDRDQKLYMHRLNTAQLQDVLVFEYPDEPLYKVMGSVSDDGKYLIIYVIKDAFFNMVLYTDINNVNVGFSSNIQYLPIASKLDAKYQYITNEGSFFVFRTNRNAPNFRIALVDVQKTEEEMFWDDLVPEHEHDVLHSGYAVANDKLVLHYITDAKSHLQMNDLRTGELLQAFNLDVGFVDGFFGKRWLDEMFFHFVSFYNPGTVYYMDFKNNGLEPVVYYETQSLVSFSEFEMKQVFYPSRDGTQISMYILYKKGMIQDSSNPVLLRANGNEYGAMPNFDMFNLFFMKNFNGIVAIPYIRGSGECGGQWHAAGRLLNKQREIEDFEAAAEYLIAEKFSRPALITAMGRTDGALVVAASINQRPYLFGASIICRGLMDMLRYHKLTTSSYWSSEYGTSDNVTYFYNLLDYSPLYNVRTPLDHRYEYPATLVMTSDYDNDVVHPAHSLKYIATLQDAVRNFRQYRPLLATVKLSGGRGFIKSTSEKINDYTDIMSFMSRSLGLTFRQ